MPALDTGNLRIHYALSGREDGDIVVLSNSLGSNLRMWDKVLPALEADYRVLRYDARGHGASGVPTGPYTLSQLGRDVLDLLDALGLERVHFCGLSLGGLVGQWLGIHTPQRISRMVLANTAARIGSGAMWDERIASVRKSGMEALAPATLTRWFTPDYRDRHLSDMAEIRQMIASTSPEGYAACCAVLRDADLRTCLPSLRIPCLVITGKHDPATPSSDGTALAAALPCAEYLELDASHLSAWERANEFGAAVRAFFRSGGRFNG